jgi:hypothetical protein
MGKNEQHNRIMQLINELAMKAVALPARERTVFIDAEIDAMKRTYRRAYAADAAMLALSLDFAEKMREWGLRLTGMIEVTGGKIGQS